ncbi:hypothetical protein PAXRUDRAFT_834669 [Paxillus rubicundulus Ve08.2h10]|uniref:Uncharacterized protein n=1 Tax=Paxillus rubicundulus Ve08.2h10 TaxID=930991 RepID=A0A0D0CS44_9AGAM|nr:hypothetical protein PAXRUDRAFT_834669 [Paxillus rubicundulus Ve08.2h10]
MATSQTYPPTSLTPTNTLDSSPSTLPDEGNDSDDMNVFPMTGSPPLVVGLLALGMFTAAIVAVVVWKRRSQTRGLTIYPVRINHQRPMSPTLGTKPVLWDKWARFAGSEETGWENVVPFAAVLSCPVQPVVHPSNSHSPARPLGGLMSVVKRFYPPVLPSSGPPPLPAVPNEEEMVKLRSTNEIQWGEGSSLQISVAVAMPTQRVTTSEGDAYLQEPELGEFYIGTIEVPWSEGG